MLLLPGGTLVPDPCFIVLDALGQRYRVIAPAYPAAHMMAELVTGLNGILDVEHIAAVNVVGSSFGGYLAQCFVRAHPDRVNSLGAGSNRGTPFCRSRARAHNRAAVAVSGLP